MPHDLLQLCLINNAKLICRELKYGQMVYVVYNTVLL